MLRELFSRRLVVVTGKGGVGKSTIASSLALVASRRLGKRTLLVELEAQRSIARFFGRHAAGYEPREMCDDISLINITGQEAIRDYLKIIVPVGKLVDKITAHPLYRYFTDAAPGLKELLTLGKIWKLADEKRHGRPVYDLIVVDGFSTGQALNMFRAPIEVFNSLKVGPIASKARHLVDLIRDPLRTTAVIVTLPEEMPMAESVELHRALTSEIRVDCCGIIVNRVLPKRFRHEELAKREQVQRELRAAVRELGTNGDHATHAYRAAHEQMLWRHNHEHYLKRMMAELPGPFLHLLSVFDCDGDADLVERLATTIARELTPQKSGAAGQAS